MRSVAHAPLRCGDRTRLRRNAPLAFLKKAKRVEAVFRPRFRIEDRNNTGR
jgi:hypothetical protein